MDGSLWRGWFDDTWIAAPTHDAYAGDGWKKSQRWAGLTLEGPFTADALRIQISSRAAEPHETFLLPSGPTARFVVDGERGPVVAPTAVGWAERTGRYHPKLGYSDADQSFTRYNSRGVGSRATVVTTKHLPRKPFARRAAA